MFTIRNLPAQQLSFSKKNKEWRMAHLDWADKRTFFYDNSVRKSLLKKRINYNLINGKLDMEDLSLVLNPEQISASYIPEKIQHYPIMNSKLNVLRGEELKRRFNFRVIVTNPTSLTDIEDTKQQELFSRVQALIETKGLPEDQFNAEVEKLQYYANFEYQDFREMRANHLLNHYLKELAIPLKFNHGFMDALVAGEEIYQCDIVGGEPTFERLNPMKVHIFRNGYSNRIEDADMIILIDYWSPGRITDTFYDSLTKKDREYIESLPQAESTEMGNTNEADSFVNITDVDSSEAGSGVIVDNFVMFGQATSGIGTNYYDNNGNIRVLRVYWKSRRKIKKVKSFDPQSGEETYNFYPENYLTNEVLGEEETIFWVNEAWEGTKIGKNVYVNMRPKLVQYNKLSNPSKCHFGIIGSVYNLNDSKPYSLVDAMKPYSYLYDVIHDRLNKAIAANWGRIVKLDLAMVPKGWEIDKWLHYAKIHHLAIIDSFKEGNKGAATGKLAGMMNNQSSGVIDAETGNYIQQHLNYLEVIKYEMGEVAGISRQREGQVSNRETVGGVERATLQSSHITEAYFSIHDDVKRRALECLLETAKIALRGGSLKFQYILGNFTSEIVNIEGDEFAENDYGLVVDGSPETQQLAENLKQLAQAALQNQTLSFSSIMKIWTSPSLSEIQRTIEREEMNKMQLAQQNQQQMLQQQQEELEARKEMEMTKMDFEREKNMRDNETKILVAEIQKENEDSYDDGIQEISSKERLELDEKIRQFNEKLSFDYKKLSQDMDLKEKELKVKSKTT